jgi:hypothetical protein
MKKELVMIIDGSVLMGVAALVSSLSALFWSIRRKAQS